ncbi:hypothetical protein HRI_001021000 [Hibiscus trionum]|uniref:RING-type E3 ubiquitin transferase n=1 Tax=Hibiscus trionum TaxID=183268 RepID=A0A9W7LQH8_HIBTR|nr:hypothetical protein HRI_001021000 [Hibiscus trionum]
MELDSNSYHYNVVSHHIHDLNIRSQTSHIPSHLVQIELRVDVDLRCHDPIIGFYDHPFFQQQTLCFGLNILRNHDRAHGVLDAMFLGLGINIFSASYDIMIQDIIEGGLGTTNRILNSGYYCKALNLHYKILVETEIDQEALMTTALAESTSEFESINYGMVAAKESSIGEMLKRVRVDGDAGNCMICLEELEVGYEASRMPCCHFFHGDCIEKWLKQSHYCPICRFEMPTN